ncbi:MAG: ATP-binding protein [Burkholderiaceae bacterium]|nr:ATP-binding protein [Burkholderiaceae bacterium]
MKYANEIFFLVFALILWGLLFGARFILKSDNINQSKKLWLTALTLIATSFTLFAFASTISLFLLTLANTFFVASFIYFGLFCRSLNTPIPKNVNILVLIGLFAFAVLFEYLRQKGSFIERVGLVTLIGVSCLIWELRELRHPKATGSTQLRFLNYTIVIELILTSARILALYIDGRLSTPNLYQEGVVSASSRWAWLGISVLSYVAVLGYWLEKLSIENVQVTQENEIITKLLKEKEHLIFSLLKVNKTTTTGALSASIAHELNQPLGASLLNIQFLKMQLEKGIISPELGKEILNSLEVDNNRAATIVNSLRSIFREGESNAQEVQVGDLISGVINIAMPDLNSKNIQIQLYVDNDLIIRVNPSEIEQVILNLVNNAAQSLANSGTLQRRIDIEAHKAGASVQLNVSDNGPGVSPEFKPDLFELLTTTKQTGMGLGLWLCKHIVTRYSGSIHYEDAVGGGAKFRFELPLAV